MVLKKILLLFFILFCVSSIHAKNKPAAALSPVEIASHHPLIQNKPAIDFFEGALLGNGGMGVVLTTRPDGIVMYFGHNNVWDIRLAENNREKIGTFAEVFEKVNNISDKLDWLFHDEWYNKYSKMTGENYSKPYPRPFPCGAVLIGFDRREVELTGHKLDISNGLCEVFLLDKDKRKLRLQVFVDMMDDKLWMRLINEEGDLCGNIFKRIRIIPDPSIPGEFPHFEYIEDLAGGELSFRQVLPCQEADKYDKDKGHLKDNAFRLTVNVNSKLAKTTRINWHGNEEKMEHLEASIPGDNNFLACVSLQEGLNTNVSHGLISSFSPDLKSYSCALTESTLKWEAFWDKSGVRLADKFLERIWYHNLYFFNCAVKDGAKTPGIFANWSYNDIGTSWHGDYHMNYNTQQPFWVTFSSNHLEKNLSYVDLIEFLMPVSKKWAKDYYGLPGAYIPHSAYPVEMTMNPYPVPDWGWEICETPWAVQGLWWHFTYSADTTFLRNRAYEPIKAAVEFLVAYMKRPVARGGKRWDDNKYHIFPTVPPELYGLRPGFQYNYDCTMDLALTKFIFSAFLDAAKILKTEDAEKDLLSDITDILNNFPEYPLTQSPEYGKVYVSVPGEHDQMVYNVPANLAAVFPGEDIGLHSAPEELNLARNTYYNQQNEGGNDLVFCNLQAARLRVLDLGKFKRQINYCLLPNGTASDRILQVHGRYSDLTDYGYMDRMGIWFENFALPAVINECLMQSYQGTIRLFPNWPMDKDAEFRNLRAAGAFLVSTTLKKGKVREIKVESEAGSSLKIILPWKNGGSMTSKNGIARLSTAEVEVKTEKGEVIVFQPE